MATPQNPPNPSGTVRSLMTELGQGAFWAVLIRGILSVASKTFRGWSKILGVLDIIFAIIMFIVVFSNPGAALIALAWIIAIYTIIFGIFLIIMAFAARSQTKKAFGN